MTLRRPVPVSAEELLAQLQHYVSQIQEGAILEVACASGPFILGAEFPGLFACYDAEYGWPELIELDAVASIEDLFPGRRRHPVLTRRGRPVAMAIKCGEFEVFKRYVVGTDSNT